MSVTGCSSIPFGAAPVCPCRESKKPTPWTTIGIGGFGIFQLVVAVSRASNCARACAIAAVKRLVESTHAGSGISTIIRFPTVSRMIRW